MAIQQFRIEGLEGVYNTLRQLPPEIVSKRGGPVRAALRRAAKIIQVEAQANVQKIIDEPNKHDIPTKSTGLLKKSIIVKKSRPIGGKGEAVIVSIRGKRSYENQAFQPKSRSQGSRRRGVPRKRQLFANDVGFMLEKGTSRRRPMPWIRPAFDTKHAQALSVFTSDLVDRIQKIQKKLERQNRVKQ